jgi:hypothetical protein
MDRGNVLIVMGAEILRALFVMAKEGCISPARIVAALDWLTEIHAKHVVGVAK